ncbi:MAG: hypothetical protein IT494_08055 [Gammaproteobacteria bacterium]|nr:hypothetical protein [Gammaproteobacteria bacterium]
MNDERFNMELRRFLKKVGINGQREIENATRQAIESGRIRGNETLQARMVLEIDGLGLRAIVEDDIALE